MSINQPQSKKVSYADYLTWPDEPRYEIIDGIPYLLAAPSRQHQDIVMNFAGEMYSFLKGSTCRVYTAPFDVRLSATVDNEEYQVVQPDISVVCEAGKLDEKGCKGAPDLIVEVLSPSTWQRDRIEKMNQYQKHNVKEYVIIYPNEKVLEQYVLDEHGKYQIPYIYKEGDVFNSHMFPEFTLKTSDLFS
ncbi:Uma2 family endonuclease [Neobacillus sp. OS1-33]|uniref:Uma2 family endonuclease n=1 Tax=Neobacillus sp. OS1-33 TaxID=3070683 RepID=UPI0027DF5CCE|nr:Uma2 family endonuclease [Neobacillus sp. OS1-33]WML24876.1 Uma2 family endonuclease [Neobacillus sp. OS1-33]